jgi:hypothetical protein
MIAAVLFKHFYLIWNKTTAVQNIDIIKSCNNGNITKYGPVYLNSRLQKERRKGRLYTILRKEQISVRIEPVTISNDYNTKAVTPRGP